MARVHTSNPRKTRRLWEECGGQVHYVHRTGEERWVHPAFSDTIRINSRRQDVPAIILCRLNHLLYTDIELAR